MVKVKTPFSKPILGMLLSLSLMTIGCQKQPASRAAGLPPVPVKLEAVKLSNVEESSEFVGTLEAQKRVVLQPETQGRIIQIYVEAGTRVAAGQPIAQLDPERPAAQYSGAIANINVISASIKSAQADIRAAKAEKDSAQVDLKLQQQQYKRTEFLVGEGALSESDLDIQTKNRDAAIETLRAARDRLDAAIANLKQQQAALQQARAEAATANTDLQFTLVRSPIAGMVGDFPVKQGDYVSVGQTITTITQNNALDLRVSVPANRSDQLRLGLPVQLLDSEGKRPLVTGRINFISPQVDTEAQAILTKFRFGNAAGRLRDGQFVRTKILWRQDRGILIPTVAVSRIGGQSFVFLADTAKSPETGETMQIARQTPVTLGPIQGESYQVQKGIAPGDRLVVSNILKLRDGAPIQPEL